MELQTATVASPGIKQRQEDLRSRLKEAGMESVVLTPGPSMYYLTGLHLPSMERPIVGFFGLNTEPVFVLPEFEIEQLRDTGFELECFAYGENPSEWQFAFDQAAAYCGIFDRLIGVNEEEMRVFVLKHLQESAWTTKFVDARRLLAKLRSTKSEEELGAMQNAVQIAERALSETVSQLSLGMSELDIARILFRNLLESGSAPALPFQPIVATGVNSANPHATPGERTLSEGDILLVDWGANYQSYFSDLTRVFAVGEVDTDLQDAAAVVLAANEAARSAAAPGVRIGDVDLAARKVIEDAGLGKYFTHRTGHGLGLAVHEPPYIREDVEDLLVQGMTFTIEPGIYLPGKGGIRIEDDVFLTHDGCVSLSTMDRQLKTLDL